MLRICAPSLAGVLPSLAVGRSVASAWRLLNPPLLAGPSAQSARLVPERSVSDGLTSLPRVHGSEAGRTNDQSRTLERCNVVADLARGRTGLPCWS